MKDTVGEKMARADGFSATLVVDQLRQRVPGGIGVYTLGLLQGFREICLPSERSDADNAMCKNLQLTLLASKKILGQDPLGEFMTTLEKDTSPRGVSFYLSEKAISSRAFMLACRFGVLPLPKSDLLASTSLVVPKYKGPLSVALHDLAFRDTPETFTAHGRRWHEAALKRALIRANGFSVPTREMAFRVRAMTDKPAVVIGYGCDHLPEPDFDGARKILRKLFGDRGWEKRKLLLAVGTLEPRKNLARIIKAFSVVKNFSREEVDLLIIGPRGWGNQPELTEGVHLVGSVSAGELAAFYKIASALVYAPILEGYGLPIAEAFYSGLPVISSNVPSAREATLLVDPLDEEDIAKKILFLLQNPTFKDELIRQGSQLLPGTRWRDIAVQHLLFWRYLQARYAHREKYVTILQGLGIYLERSENNNLNLLYTDKESSYRLQLFA